MSKKNQVNLNVAFSVSDYKMLTEQSARLNLSRSEYIRAIIQSIGIAESLKEDDKGNVSVRIGEYGYRLSKEDMEGIARQLEDAFTTISKQYQRVIIAKPKGKKRVYNARMKVRENAA